MKILGFGAVLWDEIRGELNIGGAVFNLIAHSKKLGAEAYFLTAIGNDELGNKTFDGIKSMNIHTDLIKRVNVPTCVVKVSFNKIGAPSYTIDDFTSWDLINVNRLDISIIDRVKFDYFCFGTVEQRNPVSLKSLKSVLEICSFKYVFYDMNLRLHYYNKQKLEYSMGICDILKMNEEEASIVKKIFRYNEKGYKDLTKRMREEFDIKIICITKGNLGACISSEQGFEQCPGYKVKVADTVGAGDAFSAALIYKHHLNFSKNDACDFACKLGAFIASRRGAVPYYDLSEVEKQISS